MTRKVLLILALTGVLSLSMVGLQAWAVGGGPPDAFVCHRNGPDSTGVVVPVPNSKALSAHLAHGDSPLFSGSGSGSGSGGGANRALLVTCSKPRRNP